MGLWAGRFNRRRDATQDCCLRKWEIRPEANKVFYILLIALLTADNELAGDFRRYPFRGLMRGMRGGLRIGFILLLQLVAVACWAASVRTDGATVYVNELAVATFKTGSAARDAKALVKSLENASGAVSIVKGKKIWSIKVGSRNVLNVDASEAKANNTTVPALAGQWAARLKEAFALPELQLDTSQVKMTGGNQVTIPLAGTQAATAVVESSDEQVVKVSRKPGVLILKGIGFGSADVMVSIKNSIRSIPVKVVPYAAKFPQSFSAAVTGAPATTTTVQGAIRTAIESGFKAEPDARWVYQVPDAGQILPGQSKAYTVKVRASGSESVTNEGNVTVTIRNENIGPVRESELWYCNNPETIKNTGTLFVADLKMVSPARLLYHHINATTWPLFFRTRLINTSDVPAKVLVIPGDSAPDKNPVLAGLQAAEQFCRNWIFASGEVITVPPRSILPLSIRRIAPNDTVSGLCSLQLISGPQSVQVRADSIWPFSLDTRWQAALASPTPWQQVGTVKMSSVGELEVASSEHIYPNPFRTEAVTYTYGKAHGFVRIGQKAIERADGQSNLDGNFGVTYKIDARLENPTDVPVDIEVVFEASAGYSGALFVLGDKMVRTPLLQPKEEVRLMKYRLEAGNWEEFSLMTIPLSGSSYPATLKIRPIDRMSNRSIRELSTLLADVKSK